ncbi:MAG: Alkaline phosphatase synthesis sensor protein PhoR [Burkholderia gladioli]|nr:MAG: Alkaline phosphatase synthesis sensor protein PhoR [Burkholderia gladioli]
MRYTPEGGKLRVCCRRDGTQAVFSVKDSGFGIPSEDLTRLTERFYRVDRSRSRDTGGTRLGLAIVKHVLQRHDGQLLIQSEEGRGSTFTARFPAQRTVTRRSQQA